MPAGEGSRSSGVTRTSSRGIAGSVAIPVARPYAIRIAAGGSNETPSPSATSSTSSGRASTSQAILTLQPDDVTRAVDARTQRGVWAVFDELMFGEVAQPDAAAVREGTVRADGELQ